MRVIGNPITLGGGFKIPKPTGDLYNTGTFNNDIVTSFVSFNQTTVTNYSSYVRVDAPATGKRYAGLIFGPLKFGSGYTATGRGPQNGIRIHLTAIKDPNQLEINGGVTTVDTDNQKSNSIRLDMNETGTITLDTSGFLGKTGYIMVNLLADGYSASRSDARITKVTAT